MSDLDERPRSGGGRLQWWASMPLYVRILVGLVLGIVVGLALGPSAKSLDLPAGLILGIPGALAPPLILVAVVHALLTAEIRGGMALRLGRLLLLNTLTAIIVGLAVANLLKPGRHAHLPPPPALPGAKVDLVTQLLENIPDSLLRP